MNTMRTNNTHPSSGAVLAGRQSFRPSRQRRAKDRVLLVSPDGAAREAVEEALQRNDFRVLLARTGQEALRILKEHLVDLIVLDYGTPLARHGVASRSIHPLEAITDASPFLPLVLVCEAETELDHSTSLMADAVVAQQAGETALIDAIDTVLEESLRQRAQRKAGGLRLHPTL